jgi:hypothetical protein
MMNACHVERRLQNPENTPDSMLVTTIVQQGLLVQQSTGTVSAIEYLQRNAVHGAVIHRVLSGNALRTDDRLAVQRAACSLNT